MGHLDSLAEELADQQIINEKANSRKTREIVRRAPAVAVTTSQSDVEEKNDVEEEKAPLNIWETEVDFWAAAKKQNQPKPERRPERKPEPTKVDK